jgi:hypothetical protein
MVPSNWIAPAMVFFAGAVFGRVFGVKPLVKGAMTAATMSGVLPNSSAASHRSRVPARRRAAPARKRVARKRSQPTAA